MNRRELAYFLCGIPHPGRILEPIDQLPALKDLSPDTLWREFSSAVSRQATGFSRIGVSVGGLDSSGILAALVEERGADGVIALTYRGSDDDPYVDELCDHLGVECVTLEWGDAVSRLGEGLVVGGEPHSSVSAAFYLQLATVAKAHGVDGMLSGYAGDDILGGEFDLFAPLLRERPLTALSAMLSARLPLPDSHSPRARVWQWGLAPTLRRALPARVRVLRARKRLTRAMPWLPPEVLEVIRPGLEDVAAATRPPTTPLEVYEYRATLPEFRLYVKERAQLARESGVEQHDPYLDSKLVAMLSSIPITALYSGGTFRGLFRAALQNRVPDRIRKRLGKGRAREMTYRPEQVRPLIALTALSHLGLADPRQFGEAFERRGPFDGAIWRTLAAEAYLQRASSSGA